MSVTLLLAVAQSAIYNTQFVMDIVQRAIQHALEFNHSPFLGELFYRNASAIIKTIHLL